MIFEVEKMVLETEMVREEQPDGSVKWVENVRGRLSLYDIEMALESNPDMYAYFVRDDGTVVTKFDIERKLQEIKKFIYAIVRQRSSSRRFRR
jgi:hypothetical protein